jgi:hypothetical protein
MENSNKKDLHNGGVAIGKILLIKVDSYSEKAVKNPNLRSKLRKSNFKKSKIQFLIAVLINKLGPSLREFFSL